MVDKCLHRRRKLHDWLWSLIAKRQTIVPLDDSELMSLQVLLPQNSEISNSKVLDPFTQDLSLDAIIMSIVSMKMVETASTPLRRELLIFRTDLDGDAITFWNRRITEHVHHLAKEYLLSGQAVKYKPSRSPGIGTM